MISIGIHIGHDGGCALARDGQILYAIAEERLVRHKYHNGWWNSLLYCVNAAVLSPLDIDLIIVSNAGPAFDLQKINYIYQWGFSPAKTKLVVCDHHISHAIGAISLSDFEEGMVFVGDAGGNGSDTETAFIFDKNQVTKIYGNPDRPLFQGLGTTYEAFTNLLGFSDQESGKVMALAAYGNLDYFSANLFDLTEQMIINSRLKASHRWGAHEFLTKCGLALSYDDLNDARSDIPQHIATFVQQAFQNCLLQVLDRLIAAYRPANLILTGGIALNCSANGVVREQRLTKGFFVSPIASDIGLPIGNAIYGHYLATGELIKQVDRSVCYGKAYSESEIVSALERKPDTTQPGRFRKQPHTFYRSSNIFEEVAALIQNEHIVGWFNGRSECGPRALGCRSIIAKVDSQNMRELLNKKVKKREWFRPFGPSILQTDLHTLGIDENCTSYMTEALMIKRQAHLISSCVHVDGTSRVHSVGDHTNRDFNKLLTAIKQNGEIGAVLNTSFNVQEPIVESPSDAISTFLRSDIECLVIQDFIVKKV
jgi:carbamoyltransferase